MFKDADKDAIMKQIMEQLEEIFKKYDVNQDGFLDKDELRKYSTETFQQMGGQGTPTEEEFEAGFKAMDKNQDGKISREEVKDYIYDMFKAFF